MLAESDSVDSYKSGTFSVFSICQLIKCIQMILIYSSKCIHVDGSQ